MQYLYKASVENRNDSEFHATTRHSAFLMDVEGRAANPVDTLLASLCACIAHYARDFMRDRQLPFTACLVRAEGRASPEGDRLTEIVVRIEMKGAQLDERQQADLLRSADRCKVYNTVKAGCAVRVLAG